MRKTISSSLFKILMCTALGASICGSFRFAQARIVTHNAPQQTLALPKELGTWKTFDSDFDKTSLDVIARKYINKDNRWVGVVVRSSQTNQVLHDLTSCLINADAKMTKESEQHVLTKEKTLDASLVSFELKKGPRRALLWFQKGEQTASNRWSWRLISTTTPSIRDAAVYYQVEVATAASADQTADLTTLQEVAVQMYEELQKH